MKGMTPLLDDLLRALESLPGIGPKSAQRIAFQLLARRRETGRRLAKALEAAMTQLGHCECCRTFSSDPRCPICRDLDIRDPQLCVVEMPSDLYALEALGQYRGAYFVLLGRLSPMEGVLPEHLGLDRLQARLAEGVIAEVIVATNPTVEGELTAQYVASLCRRAQVPCTRMAHGMPMGAELEYLDRLTLSYAFSGRRPMSQPEALKPKASQG